MPGNSVHCIIAASLPLIATGFCALAFAHSGGGGSSGSGHGGGHGHGGHRGAAHRGGDPYGGSYRADAGLARSYGEGGSDTEPAFGAEVGAGDARSLVSKRRNAAITAGCGWRMSGTA
jgi:hypothetical protein